MIVTNPLIDTHTHLYEADLLNQLDGVFRRAREAGVVGMVAIGTTVETSRECIRLANEFANVWAAIGIHPNHCNEAHPGDWEQIVSMVQLPKVVAIGETGLDRYWKDTPWPTQ